MRVLVACERSGRVRDALLRRGHDAVSCDVEPSDAPGPHIRRRVEDVLDRDRAWGLVVAFPPCTYLTAAGCHLLAGPLALNASYRLSRCIEAAQLVQLILGCWPEVPRVAVENPKPHKYARRLLGAPAGKSEPWQHGDPWTKRSMWWLRGLQPLTPTRVVHPTTRWVQPTMSAPYRSSWQPTDEPLLGVEAVPPRRRRKHVDGGHRDPQLRSLTPLGTAEAIADQWTRTDAQTLL